MKQITITDEHAIFEVIRIFESDNPVVILEFPNVFGLMAPHSLKGVNCLDAVKERLPNKCYGSFMGDHQLFRKLIPEKQQITYDFLLQNVRGAFIRFPLNIQVKNPGVTHENTHQILLENTLLSDFMSRIEEGMRLINTVSDFYDYNYQSPIISSLNISGSPNGAITNLNEAIEFGIAKDIPLLVRTNMLSEPLGSYPIFSFNHSNEVNCERNGINKNEIQKVLDLFIKQT
jgi:hypothetical protein